jgi:hypothetical protein
MMSEMTYTQEEIRALTYSPYWINLSLDNHLDLQYILEEYIEMKKDEDKMDADEARLILNLVKNPLFKKYKDVIHCGVSH